MDVVKGLLKQIKPTHDDNIVDRLHYFYTAFMLLIFTFIIGMYQFAGKPVICWSPKEFTDFWDQYVHDFCFVENTYVVNQQDGDFEMIPGEISDREKSEIIYYQWIPFVFLIQFVLFYTPHIIWSSLSSHTGIHIQKLVEMTRNADSLNEEKRLGHVNVIAAQIRESTSTQRSYGAKGNPTSLVLRFGKNGGYYVSWLYLFTKFLAIVNVVGQFFLLNSFLGTEYTYWGTGILSDVINGRHWQQSGHFPRVTFCDFEVKKVANIHRWTLQCVIWINMLNEKIFLFIWFWFAFVAIVSIIDFFYWLTITIVPSTQTSFLSKYIRASGRSNEMLDNHAVKMFIQNNLKTDGVLILRVLATNVGDLITTHLVRQLWERPPTNSNVNGPDGFSEEIKPIAASGPPSYSSDEGIKAE